MAEPADGSWYWVLYECWGDDAKWVPAQRQRNHWNSAEFRGIPLHQVKVGPELTYAEPAIAPPESRYDEDGLRRLVVEEERAHRQRMAPFYKALANYAALRPSLPLISTAMIADATIRRDMAAWNPVTGFASATATEERDGYACVFCARVLPRSPEGVIVHDSVPHPVGHTYDEERNPQ
ncbi:hypothetical protein [Cupriavidus sp. UYPR2.512]|uniref:hypothetical protein n=1 Tax=Cupriavidus sp. UYPR2.512 TaxID=1080187 RepID=UPI000376B824|nr:hypothetical protein [Cupriavidus sp. UYPR2.512]UIF90937.1 hypothetical protein KAF44_32655 [Cupriavidus necator]